MELHGSFPRARLVKNKVSLCETQYAEAGSGGLAPGWGVRTLTGPGDQGLDDLGDFSLLGA
jgi:hypothetical protein